MSGLLEYNYELVRLGLEIVEGLVGPWTTRYAHFVKFEDCEIYRYHFSVEFSKPTALKPVPEASVKVHFNIDFRNQQQPDVKFQFENESLQHRPERTLRMSQFELWIDRIYNDKTKIKNLIPMITKYEQTRWVPPEPIDEDAFYEGCRLLDSTVGEVKFDDETDEVTRTLLETLIMNNDEVRIPSGASLPKNKIPRVSTFAAMAQVLGKVVEGQVKKAGEKTPEQKLLEFYSLYPHIKEKDVMIGPYQITSESAYMVGPDEEGNIVRLPLDAFKRTKRDSQVLVLNREDGSSTEYIYKGEWNTKKSTMDGRGLFVYPDGTKYEGYVHDNEYNGFGRFIHRLGDVYEGDWYNNVAYGSGIYFHSNGVKVIGRFIEDFPEGEGVEQWPDGSRFEGFFVKGVKHGHGTFTWQVGNMYVGEWSDGLMHGSGIYQWNDGRKYEGTFNNGHVHGTGIFTWPDSRKYVGDYQNDQKHGNGEYTWPDGRNFKGTWKEGKMHGEGHYTNIEGITKRGLWQEGRRVKWFKKQ
mmetsp:Transcript_13562/g.25582  ORF Transcript_13562/g.25582 Transcript_13562/m.25582 type:complete len:522 (-) Transcript_13562:2647-4212(-)